MEKDIKNENDRYNNFIFRSPNCVDITNEDDVICLNCDKVKANFIKHLIRSDGRVDVSQKLKTRNDMTLCSLTLEQNKLEMYPNELKVHRDKTSRAKLAHQKHLKEKGVMCKFDHELMFPSNLKELG